MHAVEKILGIGFQDQRLLWQALTHPSYAPQNYQRLEFLGDRVLALMLAEWLHTQQRKEGDMAHILGHLASKEHLASVASSLGLWPYIRHRLSSHQQDLAASKLLSDVFEALQGALFLDQGYEVTCRVFLPLVLSQERSDQPLQNAKNRLQEFTQKHKLPMPTYRVLASGAQGFQVECLCAGQVYVALAKQKRAAELLAAAGVLAAMEQAS